MNAKEAADKIRPNFHLVAMPPEDRHHVLFVEAVAAELGVEPTAFNLHQVAGALDDAGIHGDAAQYPLMMYSRQHHAIKDIAASTYYPRHDFVFTMVESAEQANKLGEGWVEDISKLPPRGDTPINAPVPEAPKEFTVSDHDPRNAPFVAQLKADPAVEAARAAEADRVAAEAKAASERTGFTD